MSNDTQCRMKKTENHEMEHEEGETDRAKFSEQAPDGRLVKGTRQQRETRDKRE